MKAATINLSLIVKISGKHSHHFRVCIDIHVRAHIGPCAYVSTQVREPPSATVRQHRSSVRKKGARRFYLFLSTSLFPSVFLPLCFCAVHAKVSTHRDGTRDPAPPDISPRAPRTNHTRKTQIHTNFNFLAFTHLDSKSELTLDHPTDSLPLRIPSTTIPTCCDLLETDAHHL